MKRLILMMGALLALGACTKNEYITYSAKDGLVFLSNSSTDLSAGDSIVYSFISRAISGNQDTIWVTVSLTGKPADADRPFVIEVAPESTAKEGVDFELMEPVFPANATALRYPIVLLRTPELAQEERWFKLALRDNEQFTLGALSPATSATYGGGLRFEAIKIVMTDQVIKPSWWALAEDYYYGAYSHTKYRFMIETIGITNFSSRELNYPQITNYRALLQGALSEYEKTHGEKLKDENDEIITIPAF